MSYLPLKNSEAELTVTGGGGAEFTSLTSKTASYTAVSGDWVVYNLSAAGAAVTLTLPATPSAGDAVKVSLGVANASPAICVNIARNGSTIDGETTEGEVYNILWSSGDTVTFRCVGTGLWVTDNRKIRNRFTMRMYGNTITDMVPTTFYKITAAAVDYDYNGDFDAVTDDDYTVPLTGRYLISGQVSFNTAGMEANKMMGIFVYNGLTQVIGYFFHSALASALGSNCTGTLQLTRGDTITLQAVTYQVGSTLDIPGESKYTFLSLEYLGK